jgi:hypothetical protein
MEIYCKFATITIIVIEFNQNLFHVCHTNIHGWILRMGISSSQKKKKMVQNQLL